MDPGFYEDLAGRLYGLDDRLNSDDASIIHHFIDARHYGLAVEEIARTLVHHTIGITGQERADMLALTDRGRHAGHSQPDATDRRARAGRHKGPARHGSGESG